MTSNHTQQKTSKLRIVAFAAAALPLCGLTNCAGIAPNTVQSWGAQARMSLALANPNTIAPVCLTFAGDTSWDEPSEGIHLVGQASGFIDTYDDQPDTVSISVSGTIGGAPIYNGYAGPDGYPSFQADTAGLPITAELIDKTLETMRQYVLIRSTHQRVAPLEANGTCAAHQQSVTPSVTFAPTNGQALAAPGPQ